MFYKSFKFAVEGSTCCFFGIARNQLLEVYNMRIQTVEEVRILAVLLDNHLRFERHILSICKSVNSKLHLMSKSKYFFNFGIKLTLFKLFVQTQFDYCSSLFVHLPNAAADNRIERCFARAFLNYLKINIMIKTRTFLQ